MKNVFMALFLISSSTSLFGDMVYDPATGVIYSKPLSSSINQAEYRLLSLACHQIGMNIKSMKGGREPSKQELLEQWSFYLKGVGTPTALRLIDDLKKGKVFYPNGSVMQNLFLE